VVLVGTSVSEDGQSMRSRAVDLARRFRAIADPTRLAILMYVSKESRTIGELAQVFELSQPTVSNHVKALKESGLVQAERVGSRVNVRANSIAMENLTDELAGAFSI
jgi:ArsR family transcriptional regulator, arsenate/arsenite/antimonite-responsive transcriptional repressor